MSAEDSSLETQLYEKFIQEQAVVSWSTLRPHLERQAVFWVKPEHDLLQVGISIALDRVNEVKEYLDQDILVKADHQHPLKSNEGQEAIGYKVLVVQPYVIASPLYLPD